MNRNYRSGIISLEHRQETSFTTQQLSSPMTINIFSKNKTITIPLKVSLQWGENKTFAAKERVEYFRK